MNKLLVSVFTLVIILIFAPAISAHVTLDPKEAVIGRQAYSVRVPNERDVATTKVELQVPTGVEITGILPIPGWQHTEKKNNDMITAITWSGGTINPGEYMLFSFSTNYTGNPGVVMWKAYQTYADGQVVPWDSSSDEHPAPKVSIKKGTMTNTDDDDHDAAAPEVQSMNKSEEHMSPDMNLWISGVALLVSLTALIVSVRGKKFKI